VIDEENNRRLVFARLRALGMNNEHRDALLYFNRAGIRIGESQWTKWLRRRAAAHDADLILIDTAMAATNAEVNENDAVVALYAKALRPLATELNLAILLLHHERKSLRSQGGDRSLAMMGARQWAAQADAHATLGVESGLAIEEGKDGARLLRRAFVMRTPKVRDGEPDRPELIAVESRKDAANRLDWMRVVSEGPMECESKEARLVGELTAAVVSRQGEEVTTRELAKAVGREPENGTFKRALRSAVAGGHIENPKRGRYVEAENDGMSF
jgi:hypothetical protein